MQTPYVPHRFGQEVETKLRSRMNWLTAGVASSIAWPQEDVWVVYGGNDYILRGLERSGEASPPGITVPCERAEIDEALSRIYKFASVLSWFHQGYVDVSGHVWGSHPILYGDRRHVFSTGGTYSVRAFDCNHMPLIEGDAMRKSLAFWREGQRLRGVHDSYSFLSFYKVIESQFSKARSKQKVEWIRSNIELLSDDAAARVAELRNEGRDVSRHLFESGRCAVAHAAMEEEIIDPDIPRDRRRLREDLVVMAGLAQRYIANELGVPDRSVLYRTRNRLQPWDPMFHPVTLQQLRSGEYPDDLGNFDNRIVSIGLWPDGAIRGMERMIVRVQSVSQGVIEAALVNERETVIVAAYLDFPHGVAHINIERGGVRDGESPPLEEDLRAFYTLYYNVLGNRVAELTIDGFEPVDCEVVIPVNMMLTLPPHEAVEATVSEVLAKYGHAPVAEAPTIPNHT
ncbi:hypothetical protein N7676_13960 [Stenotrophomonas sp. GD03993]|uniref:methylamine utilization protein MauJ n=1 Tax=unclassified Stenotrophomonas TaxID=196198 RepID=UPI00117EAFE1|nr:MULTISPECIES: methylamine utilization protein MauJ [unclassified Stenotrophomonas]MBH1461380.1 hypothetical protein [Stenotrophomonas maltophilia]MDH0187966.1 hypothetical protein [Stenotrophomonas sp. GD04051]MDH0464904.1 hypothetical protein [Stenotrophomonas sp. GD03993]MDH0874964.1 hypothetical protein [Stenotrophomonas sp. GD03877]MDH2155861.1 hypothetical protein [Stenotrophomonas sp. GD03657]